MREGHQGALGKDGGAYPLLSAHQAPECPDAGPPAASCLPPAGPASAGSPLAQLQAPFLLFSCYVPLDPQASLPSPTALCNGSLPRQP